MERDQPTPAMLEELRGEGNDESVRRELAELLDGLVQRLIDEGYLNTGTPPRMPGAQQAVGGGHIDAGKQAAQQVEFNLTQKGIDFLGYRTLRHLLSAIGRSSFGSHDTPHLATGIEAGAASKP